MRRDPRELQKLERDLRVELRFVDLGAAPLRRLSPALRERLEELNELRKDVSYGEPGGELQNADLESLVADLEELIEGVDALIGDLEHVVASDAKFDYYRAAGLLADAYARTGRIDQAEGLFSEVIQFSTTPETLYNYARFLKLQNRHEQAREWAQKLLAKKRTLPRYMQRIERPWFRKGTALVKELAASRPRE